MRSLPSFWNKTIAQLGFLRKKRHSAHKSGNSTRLFRVEPLEDRRMLTAVVSTSPIEESHSALVITDIEAIYDANISGASVTDQTFVVHGRESGRLLTSLGDITSLGASGTTVTLDPANDFRPGELVQVTATAGIQDSSLVAVDPYIWQFRTGVIGGEGMFSENGPGLGDSESWDVSLADLDGDGDLDAFVANQGTSEADRVWLNNGSGIFTDSGQALGSSSSVGVSLGDLDGDGDFDAFVINPSGPSRVWLNDGNATFTDSGQALGDFNSLGLSLADLDGDGDLDAFVANHSGEANRVWLNDGSGLFVDSGQALGNSDSWAVSMRDLDGDGDLDAFVVNDSGQANLVWINQGGAQAGTAGTFLDSGQTLGSSSSFGVSLGDLDGDGDFDAFVSNAFDPSRVWLNDGSATFTDSGQSLGNSNDLGVSLGDLDGDGDLDAFLAGAGSQANQVWLNDGSGFFVGSGQPLADTNSKNVSLGDFDGDGDLDAFVANFSNEANQVLLNDGSGLFVDNGQALVNSVSRFVLLGDVDGDGDLDAFVGNDDGQANRVLLNQESGAQGGLVGTFIDSGQSLGTDGSHAGELGDLDGDGDLDAFIANDRVDGVGTANRVWLNNGSGIFSDSGQSLGTFDSRGIALGDLDGDGDLDAFVTNANGQPNRVWFNDGNANFTDSGQTIGFFSSHVVSLGDLDGDGDLDAFVGNFTNSANRVWLNDGSGTFTSSGQSLGSSTSIGVSLGDLDGDGDLDAFIANADAQPNRVWLNDGNATFTDSGQSLGVSDSFLVSLGDLDDDGDLDAVVANGGFIGNQANRVWVNQGGKQGGAGGVFLESGQSLGNSSSHGVSLGDLDGDGDIDFFIANMSGQANRVWLNENQPSADFNSDGIVDGIDFLTWQIGFGTMTGAMLDDGDADGDGDVDGDDLAKWEDQYGLVEPVTALEVFATSESVKPAPLNTATSSPPASVAELSLASGDLVDLALAVALAEKVEGASGKRDFVEYSSPLEFFSAEPIGQSDSVAGLSITSSQATKEPRDDESQSSERPGPWEDELDKAFANVFG